MSAILLWLFVINLGVAFGAGLYEHRIVVSRWLGASAAGALRWNADAARQDDTGKRFWGFVTTGPLTLLTMASLVVAWRSAGPARSWWLAAAWAALVERLFTFSYFIPTMLSLMKASDAAETVTRARQWANFNYVRHAMVLAAWLASLRAFSLFYAQSH